MSLPVWLEASISKGHDREAFDCGDAALNAFLRRHARQSNERGGAKTFVATPIDDPRHVIGFYSLSAASIDHLRTPRSLNKGLARYEVPAFRLGRLAAGRRCIRAAVAQAPDWADLALVWLAESAGMHRIATLDAADFSVYRINGRRAFDIVWPPAQPMPAP